MAKRFLLLVGASALISAFLLLIGTSILDRVNSVKASSEAQALMLSQSKLADGSLAGLDALNQQPSVLATEPALKETAVASISEVISAPAAYAEHVITLTGTANQINGQQFLLTDNTGQVLVNLPNLAASLGAGEKVSVTGMMNGADSMDACRLVNGLGMVVQVQSCGFATSFASTSTGSNPTSGQPITVAELLDNPGNYYDLSVTVTGLVTLLNDGEFLLNDGTGQILVELKDGDYKMLGLQDGDTISVTGVFESDDGYIDVNACEVSSVSGVITLSGCSGSDDGDHGNVNINSNDNGNNNYNDNANVNDDDHNANIDDGHDDDNDNSSNSNDNHDGDDHDDNSNDNDHHDDHGDDHDKGNSNDHDDNGDKGGDNDNGD